MVEKSIQSAKRSVFLMPAKDVTVPSLSRRALAEEPRCLQMVPGTSRAPRAAPAEAVTRLLAPCERLNELQSVLWVTV